MVKLAQPLGEATERRGGFVLRAFGVLGFG
jgi:hypothetical protein